MHEGLGSVHSTLAPSPPKRYFCFLKSKIEGIDRRTDKRMDGWVEIDRDIGQYFFFLKTALENTDFIHISKVKALSYIEKLFF